MQVEIMAIAFSAQWGYSGPFMSFVKSLHEDVDQICFVNCRLIGKYHVVPPLFTPHSSCHSLTLTALSFISSAQRMTVHALTC